MSNTVVSNTIWIDVKCCARCGKDHRNLSFEVLERPIDDWTHFGVCPHNKQPILMKVEYALVDEKES